MRLINYSYEFQKSQFGEFAIYLFINFKTLGIRDYSSPDSNECS